MGVLLSLQPALSLLCSFVDILGVAGSVLSLKSKSQNPAASVNTRDFQMSPQGELVFTFCPLGHSPTASSARGRLQGRWTRAGALVSSGKIRATPAGDRGSRCTFLTLCPSPTRFSSRIKRHKKHRFLCNTGGDLASGVQGKRAVFSITTSSSDSPAAAPRHWFQ